jgi:lysophospholipase L1-like esterase
LVSTPKKFFLNIAPEVTGKLSMTNQNNRRSLLKKAIALGTMAALTRNFLRANPTHQNSGIEQDGGPTFLFQGDSITDGNRARNNDWNHIMGHGYQYIISSKLWYDFPQKNFCFFNRGVSGNKVTDLLERWQKDTIEIQPDVLSILIGVNDLSAFINGNKAFTTLQYETGYRSLLQQTKHQLPNVQLVLCEPFILPVTRVKEKWTEYSSEIEKRQQVVKRLADEYDAIFVGFQNTFNNALSKAPAEYWIWDGVHPMPAGHELMAREWLSEVGKKLELFK